MQREGKGSFAQNVETTILGILVSLTIKAGLDGASSNEPWPRFDGLDTLVDWMWESAFPQLMVFMITVVRFTYGVYRVQEYVDRIGEKPNRLQCLMNFVGSLALLMMFYVAGRHVVRIKTFYAALCLAHAIDLIWFACKVRLLRNPSALNPIARELREAGLRFTAIDAATIAILLLLLHWSTSDLQVKSLGLALMFGIGIADFIVNREFFFEKRSRFDG